MDHAAKSGEEYAGYGLNNRVLQLVVVQAEALLVEDTCDFLTRILKVLQIGKHCHAQILHLHNVVLVKIHLLTVPPLFIISSVLALPANR